MRGGLSRAYEKEGNGGTCLTHANKNIISANSLCMLLIELTSLCSPPLHSPPYPTPPHPLTLHFPHFLHGFSMRNLGKHGWQGERAYYAYYYSSYCYYHHHHHHHYYPNPLTLNPTLHVGESPTVIHVRVLEGASSLSATEEAVRAEVFEGIWRA